ncbi:alpha/beta hydrolase [Planctomycetota bacterium]
MAIKLIKAQKFAIRSSLILCKLIFLSIMMIIIGGCKAQMMKTPNLYTNSNTNPFAKVATEFRDNKVDVLYVTDRKPTNQKGGSLKYGFKRSASMAYGSCIVELGKQISWNMLVENSIVRDRKDSIELNVLKVTENGRFPETPLKLAEHENEIVISPATKALQTQMEEKLKLEIQRRLSLTSRKEAYVYVHGYHSPFEDSPLVIAQLWHFLGREGVPIAYSWPAGSPGLFRGYHYDRESGEFTIFHLKQFLKILASCPDLKKIHIIAHSRGTDVAGSALRELFIEAKGEKISPRLKFKIGNVILAAPDIDLDIVMQRFGAERFFLGLDRMTIYVSRNDKAIGVSEWLFTSRRRLGQLRIEDIPADDRESFRHVKRTYVIDALVDVGASGHYYFYLSPAVSSDLILVLRDDLDPGKANGRPLTEVESNFWQLHDDYPNYSNP